MWAIVHDVAIQVTMYLHFFFFLNVGSMAPPHPTPPHAAGECAPDKAVSPRILDRERADSGLKVGKLKRMLET